MDTGDGPISGGLRRAILAAMASGKTAYGIAAEAGLAPSQIYRFLAEDPGKHRGLSIKAMDAIAELLGLELGARQAPGSAGHMAIPSFPASVDDPLADPPVPPPLEVTSGTEPEAGSGELPPLIPDDEEDPVGDDEDGIGDTTHMGGDPYAHDLSRTPEMAARLQALRDRLRDDDDDDDEEEVIRQPSPQQIADLEAEREKRRQANSNIGYDPQNPYARKSTGATASFESTPEFPRTGWQDKIEIAMEGIENPALQKFAAAYMKPRGGPDDMEKA